MRPRSEKRMKSGSMYSVWGGTFSVEHQQKKKDSDTNLTEILPREGLLHFEQSVSGTSKGCSEIEV